MYSFHYKHGDRPLEGYTIQRAAGRGGFGEVYQAVSDGGREVALKAVLGYEQIELRGIAQCMNLKSPHLVTIFDVKHNAEGRPFVVMEYIGGPNLRQLLDGSPAGMGPQKAAFFLREIAKGLTYLHDCGVVHRDLKPANIFYENGQVKIGDYGLSKAISTDHHSGQTVTVGTVHYMAPEVGAGKYDRGIDIYALGAVLYELLTGTVPHVGATPTEVLLKHLSVEPDVSGIPEPFATAIRRAMHKDPIQRYQNVQEMVEAVFGAEHVQQSMSVFSADELSIVAERAARKLPVLAAVGAGSGGTAPVGGGGGGRTGSSSVVGPGDAVKPDFWQRMANAVDHAVDYNDPTPAAGQNPAAPASPAADPMPARQRWVIAALVSVVAALATLPFSGHFGAMLFVLTGVWGGVGTLRLAHRHVVPHMEGVPWLLRRLMLGVIVCVAAVLSTIPAGPFFRPQVMIGAWAGVCIALLVTNLTGWLEPARPARVCTSTVLRAAIPGALMALFVGGAPHLAFLALAGMCMAAQVLTPWQPASPRASRRRRSGAACDWNRPPAPATAAAANVRGVAIPAAPAPAAPPAPPPPPPPLNRAAALHVRHVPAFVSVLWLLAMAAALTATLMFFVAAGNSRHPGDVGPFAALGIDAVLAFLLCLNRAFRRTFTGWWAYLFRPVLGLMCVQSILTSIVVMANANYLRDDEAMMGAFFIAFPAALLLLMAVLPRTPLGAALARPPRPRAAGAAARASSMLDPVSALILCGLWIFGVSGIHRMAAGKVWTGILWFFTFGLFGIGQLVDLVFILTGQFTDSEGRRIPAPFAPPETTARARLAAAPPEVVPPPEIPATPEVTPMNGTHPQPAVAAPPGLLAASWPGSQSGVQLLSDVGRRAGSFAATLLSLVGLLIVVAALLVGLTAVLGPGVAGSGMADDSVVRDLREQELRYPDWWLVVHRMAISVSIVLWLVGAGCVLLARRRHGIAHMARGGLGTLGMVLSFSHMHLRFQQHARGPLMDEQVAMGLLKYLLEPEVLVPAAVAFFFSMLLLAWPPNRGRVGTVATSTKAAGELQRA